MGHVWEAFSDRKTHESGADGAKHQPTGDKSMNGLINMRAVKITAREAFFNRDGS